MVINETLTEKLDARLRAEIDFFSQWLHVIERFGNCGRVNLKKLACGAPHPAIIGLSVMKNRLVANRWSL